MGPGNQETSGAANDRSGHKDKSGGVLGGLALFTQLGLSMAACVLIGVLAGGWLDSRLGTGPWLLLAGSMLGAASALKAMYDLTVKGMSFPSARRMLAMRAAKRGEKGDAMRDGKWNAGLDAKCDAMWDGKHDAMRGEKGDDMRDDMRDAKHDAMRDAKAANGVRAGGDGNE